MRQVAQKQADGRLQVVEVPRPVVRPGGVLVRTAYSLISAGTERSSVEVARKSLLGKAKARPDQVRKVLDNVKQQGLGETYQKVRSRLDQLSPLGYSSAGVVVEVGTDAGAFAVGDRVACAGAGYAAHADFNFVPRNLCASAGTVPLDAAAFGTVGAIAMQGVRQADVRVGESVAVVGLGLVGLLTVQILKAAGCRVLGVEPNDDRAGLARSLGCDATASPAAAAAHAGELTGGVGVDAVLITAATSSSAPVALAGQLCRDRGTVVMVGATGMEVPRAVYFEKELDFRLSRSYGPGRYDPEYEEKGRDYPIGYVRWTEQRNLAAFIGLVAEEKVRVRPLITHTFPMDRAAEAYDLITDDSEPYLAVLIDYGLDEAAAAPAEPQRIVVGDAGGEERVGAEAEPGAPSETRTVGVGVVGAGSFATGVLIPALAAQEGVRLGGIASASGLSARSAAENHGFAYAAPDAAALLDDEGVDALVVATRHDTHGPLVVEALERGKPVFVEKPLAVNAEDLEAVKAAAAAVERPFVMVGFNRRFAPTTRAVVDFFADTVEPLVMSYRVNAGFLPPEHWLHDPLVGGGRMVGEGCHFVDLMMFLAGSPPVEVFARALPDGSRYRQDNVTIQIRFANGAVGTLTYLANGDRAVPKERLEVSGGGATAILDDFRRATLARGGKLRKTGRPWTRQDKGHRAESTAFVEAVRSAGTSPIRLDEAVTVTETTFRILDSLRSGMPEAVGAPGAGAAGPRGAPGSPE